MHNSRVVYLSKNSATATDSLTLASISVVHWNNKIEALTDGP